MVRLIIKRFVKNYQDVNDRDVRESYGVLSGVLGIICNLGLFAMKLSVGLLTNSIAVISDAFNNLSDMGTSLVAIIGVKLSNRPPDQEHPHGHGRYEYIASLIVSFVIFAVGLQLLGSSFDKLTNRDEVLFSSVSMIILTFSVLVKAWMFSYNRYIGDTINSTISRATANDSLSDVIATSAVIVGTVLGQYVTFSIDGLLGLVISCLIMYTGFSTAKDSVHALLGSSPDPELIQSINSIVLSARSIDGVHDLMIHDYGPGRIAASIHAEVSGLSNVADIHSEIDDIERLIERELGVSMVIHMDPGEQSAAK